MYCIKCGKEIQNHAAFCPFCGNPSAANAQQTPQQAAPQQMPQQTSQAPYMAMPPQSGVSYGGDMQTAGKKSGSGKQIGIALAVIAAVAAVIVTIVVLKRPSGGSASPGTNAGVNNAATQGQESEIDLSDVRKGDIITFGSYEQDGNTANGAEPIEWEVLETDSDSVLVISKYVLDCVQYNTELEDVTWETCTLRNWLNSDFYSRAFNAAEQSQIMESGVVNKDNEYDGTSGGNNTRDKVFCLSMDEIYRCYEFNANHDEEGYRASEALITEATPHALKSSLHTYEITKEDYKSDLKPENYSEACIGKTGAGWWLRSPGYDSHIACRVRDNGLVGWNYFTDVNAGNVGVRPAMRLRR